MIFLVIFRLVLDILFIARVSIGNLEKFHHHIALMPLALTQLVILFLYLFSFWVNLSIFLLQKKKGKCVSKKAEVHWCCGGLAELLIHVDLCYVNHLDG